MATIFLKPVGSLFPGNIAGGYGVSDSTTRWTTAPPFATGTKAEDALGNEWTLVKAGASIAANDPVVFNATLDDCRSASAAQQLVVGVATAAIASGSWGWVQSRGQVTCKVVVATAANSLLVTGAVAAQLELADATDFAGARAIVALVTGVAAGSSVYLA